MRRERKGKEDERGGRRTYCNDNFGTIFFKSATELSHLKFIERPKWNCMFNSSIIVVLISLSFAFAIIY